MAFHPAGTTIFWIVDINVDAMAITAVLGFWATPVLAFAERESMTADFLSATEAKGQLRWAAILEIGTCTTLATHPATTGLASRAWILTRAAMGRVLVEAYTGTRAALLFIVATEGVIITALMHWPSDTTSDIGSQPGEEQLKHLSPRHAFSNGTSQIIELVLIHQISTLSADRLYGY
jgi:hypothetical protein